MKRRNPSSTISSEVLVRLTTHWKPRCGEGPPRFPCCGLFWRVKGTAKSVDMLHFQARNLRACRHADGLAAVLSVAPGERPLLQRRLQEASGLFEPTEPDELYLSKISVYSHFRGAGHRGGNFGEFSAAREKGGDSQVPAGRVFQ